MADGSQPQGMQSKSIHARVKNAGAPSEAQLAAINAYTLAALTAADVYVRTFAVAHNAIDRDNECFSSAVLADFARTLPGKGAYITHPGGWNGDGMPAEGRWFEATVETMSLDEARTLLREPGLLFPPTATQAEILMASSYFVREAGLDFVFRKIDAGIVGDVSIGFTGRGGTKPLEDAAGRELEAREWQTPQEALEASLVWIGAQQGARAIKQHNPNANPEPAMPTEKTPQEKTLDDLREKAAAAEGKAGKFDAVATAIGATLADDPAKAKLLIDAGDAYRKSLISQIVVADREAKRLGDDEATVAAATKDYDLMSTAGLERMAKAAEATVPKGGQLGASDPSAPKPSAGDANKAPGGFVGAQAKA